MEMYCKHCGVEIGDSKYCPECGACQTPFEPRNGRPYDAPGYPMDTGNWGWFVLSFFIPPLGFILWLAWTGVKPLCSARCGWGCLAGVLFWVFFVPIASLMMLLALPDTYDAVGMLLR